MSENLKFILEAFHGYIDGKFEDRFKAIKFECNEQLGSCVGFIAGAFYNDKKEFAEKLADSFISNLDFLNIHEIIEVDSVLGRKIKMPSQVSNLRNDGTNLGFSFCRYVYTGNGDFEFGCWQTKYQFSYNGGLLFHGLGEVMAVTLDKGIGWQCHT